MPGPHPHPIPKSFPPWFCLCVPLNPSPSTQAGLNQSDATPSPSHTNTHPQSPCPPVNLPLKLHLWSSTKLFFSNQNGCARQALTFSLWWQLMMKVNKGVVWVKREPSPAVTGWENTKANAGKKKKTEKDRAVKVEHEVKSERKQFLTG